jgi:hypothetical protein
MPRPPAVAPPCTDWHDWEDRPHEHGPINYWRWDDANVQQSEERLGQHIYICSCLLWTSHHDRYLGRLLSDHHPNWSAVCNYYSMVHSLRLLWFLIYGSYPTRHEQMATSFLRTYHPSVKHDWLGKEPMPEITSRALIGFIRDKLERPQLADDLPLVGRMFDEARKLRNDSNYESLILAHQYSHTAADRLNVQRNFVNGNEAFHTASTLTCSFVFDCMKAACDEQVHWLGRGGPFRTVELYRLMLEYVRSKIEVAQGHIGQDGDAIRAWCVDLAQLSDDLATVSDESCGTASRLKPFAQLPQFDMKQTLMGEFNSKVESLRLAVGQLRDAMVSQPGQQTRSTTFLFDG